MIETAEDIDFREDTIARDTLIAVENNGGVANTSEIKTEIGVDRTAKIRYRMKNKLVPANLVEVEQPPSETGAPEPKMVTLTTTGEAVAERLGDEAEEHETKRDEEIRELRAQVSELQSDVELLESAAHSHGEDITELQAAHNEVVDWIEEQVSQGELTEWIEEQAAVGERSG